jgi:hypothetical protein
VAPAFIFGAVAFGLCLSEVSAGVPLYLVSACGTAEEFVAAFRRYADRTGLFVPLAEPLPAGRRGRIALALKDGGVMIEGEAEVVASSARPSGIHARVGMTLKWVEPDEPSKTVIAELEKARLAMKPAPPTVPPRPADIPAEPRPVPPAAGGRIDAANALAECVLIGDPATFTSAAIPSGPAGKFVIPSIPTTNRAPKPPTMPPALTRPRTPSAQIPVIKPITPPAGVAKPEAKPAAPAAPAADLAPAMPVLATPVGGVPAPKPVTPPSGVRADESGGTRTKSPEPVEAIPPTPSGGVPAPITAGSSGEIRATTLGAPPLTRGPKVEDKSSRATRIGFPALKLPAMEAPAVIVGVPPKDEPPATTGSPFKRATPPQPMAAVAPRPAGPPVPRQPTPFAPLPIVRLPAVDPAVDPEQTDLTDMPLPASDEPRSLGVAIVTAVAPEASEPTRQEPPLSPSEIAAAEASGPPAPPIEPAAGTRSGGMRASELMAAIGGGDDWTMAPDAPTPTILPTRTVEMATSTRPTEPINAASLAAIDKPAAPLEPVVPEPPGDWTMSADPTADGGWTPPSKVDIPPFSDTPKGNRVVAIASAEPLNAVEWEDKPTGIGEPLVEIDPSLLATRMSEPAIVPPPTTPSMPPPMTAAPMMAMPPPLPMGRMGPMGATPGAIPTPAPGTMTMPPGVPPPLGPMPPVMTPPMSAFGPTGPVQPPPLPGTLRASEQMPMFGGPLPPGPMESTSLLTVPRSHRGLLLAIGAAAVLVAAAAIAVFGFGVGRGRGKTQPAHGRTAIGSAAPAPVIAGSDAVVAGSNAPVVETPTPTVDAGPSLCKVDVATLPVGAEIWVADTQLGVTPTTVQLPCGVEAKLELKKARLQTVRTITPGTDTSVVVKLLAPATPTVSMRVTSNPPGATITMGGRVLGITPTTIHLPAGGASLTLTKEGYASSTEHVAPKPNGTNFVTLRRRTR